MIASFTMDWLVLQVALLAICAMAALEALKASTAAIALELPRFS